MKKIMCIWLLYLIQGNVLLANAAGIKVMSYNILNSYFTDVNNHGEPWINRRPLVESVISIENPDIIGFQEDSPIQFSDLTSSFPEYRTVKSPLEPSVPDKAYRSIFYKRNLFTLIKSGSFTPLPGGQRSATWVKLQRKDTGEVFIVTNAHWNGFSYNGFTEHKIQAERTQEKISQIASGLPVIFTGDLNSANTTDPAIFYLTRPRGAMSNFHYPSGFQQFHTADQWTYVANYGTGGAITNFTIDYILATTDLKMSPQKKRQHSSRYRSYYASDHNAVISTIRFPQDKTIISPIIDLLLGE